jgi:PncC family amidohydrolase
MEDNRLEARVGAALLERRWMFCASESCTGGLLMHRLTNISGSSSYLAGGVVTYSYEAKQRLLGVRPETLATHGAVSEETAQEMVEGALKLFGADIAISITGIAGPTGGLPNKPVGLTYIGIAVPSLNLVRVDRHVWDGDRETNKVLSVDEALRKVLAVVG